MSASRAFGGWTNRLRYGAREYDAETGLYYHRARYYDPRLARFISQDPIGLAGGVNPYAYAGSDPVNATDPTGLQCIEVGGPDERVTGEGVGRGLAKLPPVRVCGGSTPNAAPQGPVFTDPGRPSGGGPGGRTPRGAGRATPPQSAPPLTPPFTKECFAATLDMGLQALTDATTVLGVGIGARAVVAGGRMMAAGLARGASGVGLWEAGVAMRAAGRTGLLTGAGSYAIGVVRDPGAFASVLWTQSGWEAAGRFVPGFATYYKFKDRQAACGQ